MTYFLNNT